MADRRLKPLGVVGSVWGIDEVDIRFDILGSTVDAASYAVKIASAVSAAPTGVPLLVFVDGTVFDEFDDAST